MRAGNDDLLQGVGERGQGGVGGVLTINTSAKIFSLILGLTYLSTSKKNPVTDRDFGVVNRSVRGTPTFL